MRWMWIDQIVDFTGERLTAIKNVSLAEEHLHDHFAARDGMAALPLMPATLIIEGMAQTAGILVGTESRFTEKVILAKVSKAELDEDVVPGETIRYTAHLERIDGVGASTRGVVERRSPVAGDAWTEIGRIDLMFSHLDQNLAGQEFPEDNFVFSENFRTILTAAGLGDLVADSE